MDYKREVVLLGEVIEIGVSQEAVGVFLEFEDSIKGVNEILEFCPWLKNDKFSYLTSTGERRFTKEGALETAIKSDKPKAKELRRIYRDVLTERIGSEEARKEIRKLAKD